MTAFADIDDLATALGLTFNASQVAQAQLLLDLATATIKSWTRQDIELVENDEAILAGTWARDLVLPQRPVVAVSAVEVISPALDGRVLAASDYEWNEGELLRSGSFQEFDFPVVNATRLGPYWYGPSATLKVTYTHGYDPIPDDIRGVCLGLALDRVRNPTGATQKSIGSFSASYGAPSAATTIALGATDKAILRRYRRWWG